MVFSSSIRFIFPEPPHVIRVTNGAPVSEIILFLRSLLDILNSYFSTIGRPASEQFGEASIPWSWNLHGYRLDPANFQHYRMKINFFTVFY